MITEHENWWGKGLGGNIKVNNKGFTLVNGDVVLLGLVEQTAEVGSEAAVVS